MEVSSITNRVRDRGGVTLAVGLDIENAFNSLPWSSINEAMKRKKFPLS